MNSTELSQLISLRLGSSRPVSLTLYQHFGRLSNATWWGNDKLGDVCGGLPPPRWARSAYDRGLEEVNDFLDLLWGFRGDESDETTWNGASKHFFLTSAEIKEDVVPLGGACASSRSSEESCHNHYFERLISRFLKVFLDGDEVLSEVLLRSLCGSMSSGWAVMGSAKIRCAASLACSSLVERIWSGS